MRRDDTAACFDVADAEFPTRVVRVDEIVDLLAVSHAPERIAAYRDAMAAGARFPPIAVLRCGRRYLIADGHKRFSAYKQLSAAPLAVQVWTLRRCLRDQWQQLGRKTRQQADLLRGGARNPATRRAAHRLFWDTVGHWQRIGRSLRRVLAGSESRSPLPLPLPSPLPSSELEGSGERERARASARARARENEGES
jgi:hypothetical protein